VPEGISLDCWKTWSPKTTEILHTRKPGIHLMCSSAYSCGYSFASVDFDQHLALKTQISAVIKSSTYHLSNFGIMCLFIPWMYIYVKTASALYTNFKA
jgi:hypothetical protein